MDEKIDKQEMNQEISKKVTQERNDETKEEVINKNKISISVRNLVEFILRSGDLDNRRVGKASVDAMQEGSRIHRKIQKRMGGNYYAEVSLSKTVLIDRDGVEIEISVEGRADGIILQEEQNEDEAQIMIDEIKCIYMDLNYLTKPIPVHRAQAMCYAYIYGEKEEIEEVGIRLTYCNIETEEIKYFHEVFSYEELKNWFYELIEEYGKWAIWQYKWRGLRNKSIKELQFPFDYRQGQKKLITDVYRSIIRSKRLFIEAPTGVGKTISTVFPTIKAMGEEKASKIFYLTAKTITRSVAEETVQLLEEKGLSLKAVTITAKDKLCVLEKPDCNPLSCERAKGHYDRVNNCVFEMINKEKCISRDLILKYATKHKVCPFEMCLDVTTWADMVICDYNYVFDPNVYLRRFFEGKRQDYVFLIDEAHNLVDRASEMYSAVLYKEQFLEVRRIVKEKNRKLAKSLDTCNKELLKWKKEWEGLSEMKDISTFTFHLMNLLTVFVEFLDNHSEIEEKDKVLQLYFDISHFLKMYEGLNEKYIIYTDYTQEKDFLIKLLCVDPSDNLKFYLDKGRSAIFFSATLLPIQYYREQLGGREEDYAVYAPSPFLKENQLLLIGSEVSTKYSRRTDSEYMKILNYIEDFTQGKKGNYIVFFPSYQMLNRLAEMGKEKFSHLIIQKGHMTEPEREAFLNEFKEEPEHTKIGFCVMGGIFGEGIDLKNDRLIGVIIVGTGLPMISSERNLLRDYYDNKSGKGFDYAYLYQGMNKVMQAAGRVIRTMNDKGAILLLDDRFLHKQYQNLFPREWFPNVIVNRSTLKGVLDEFWGKSR